MLVFLYVRYLRDTMFRYPLYMAKILSILAHTQNIFSPLFYIQNFICYNKGQMIFPLSKPILTTDRKHQRFWQSNTKREKSKRQKIQMGGEGGTLVYFTSKDKTMLIKTRQVYNLFEDLWNYFDRKLISMF